MKTPKEHVMFKEILEQEDVIKNIIKKYVDFDKGTVFFSEFDQRLRDFKKISRVTFLGCGTSYHAAIYGNYVFEEFLDFPCEFEFADEFLRRKTVIEPGTMFVLFSQSGQTADVVSAAEKIKDNKCFIVGVTNDINSKLAGLSDVTIDIMAGKEEALAATKTFTSQLFLIVLLAIYIGGIDRKPPIISKKAIEEIKDIPKNVRTILKSAEDIKNIVNKYKYIDKIVVLGEKYHFPVALEGGLKIKETSYTHAEGFSAHEFLHGPKALIEKNFPVLFFAPKDSVYNENKKIIMELKERGASLILVTTEKNKDFAENVLYIPNSLEIFNSIYSIIILQLFAYFLALEKGTDVDKSRNLKKFI